jgi:hypothetical protein
MNYPLLKDTEETLYQAGGVLVPHTAADSVKLAYGLKKTLLIQLMKRLNIITENVLRT